MTATESAESRALGREAAALFEAETQAHFRLAKVKWEAEKAAEKRRDEARRAAEAAYRAETEAAKAAFDAAMAPFRDPYRAKLKEWQELYAKENPEPPEKDERPKCVCGKRLDPHPPLPRGHRFSDDGKPASHWYDKRCGRCGGPTVAKSERERASASGYDFWYECPKDGWTSA